VPGFNDDDYPRGTLNEIFPLIVIATMAYHDVSRVLIDEGRPCDTMYQEFFQKLGLKKENLCPYEGTGLQGFNGSTIRPWDLINLPVTFENKELKKSKKIVEVQFLEIPCESVYNCILGRPTLASLGAVPSMVHLKMKYNNEKNKVVTIEAHISVAKKCYQSMQKIVNGTTKARQSNTNGDTPH
jgi:hypothetical protein